MRPGKKGGRRGKSRALTMVQPTGGQREGGPERNRTDHRLWNSVGKEGPAKKKKNRRDKASGKKTVGIKKTEKRGAGNRVIS